jgi:ABC-type multidrug transport system fused ATPase/permease subunit
MYDYHAINKKSVISFAEQQQQFNSLDCAKDASLQDIFAALPLPLVEAYHLQYDVKLNVELAADSAAISVPTFSFRIREATRLLLEALGKQEEAFVNNLTEAGLVSLYKNTASERISTELDNSVLRIAHIDSSWLARSASKIKFYLLIVFTAFIIVAIVWWMADQMAKPRDITVTIDASGISTASGVENLAVSQPNASQLAFQASEASVASPVMITPVRPRKPRVVASSVSTATSTAETERLLPAQPANPPEVEKPISEAKPEQPKVEQPKPKPEHETPTAGPPQDNHLIN